MGRYIKDVQLDKPIDVVSMVMDDYVYHNRFSRTDWNGEMVYYLKDRHGRERYMKWAYAGGCFHVEAWLKGPMGGEMDLDGTGGGASRKEYRKSMEELLVSLKGSSPERLSGGHIGSDPIHHGREHEKEHGTWRRDTAWQQKKPLQRGSGDVRPRENSGTGLVLGVMALIASSVFPVLGLVFAILGLKRAKGGSSHSDRLTRLLCVLAIVWSVLETVLWIAAIVFSVVGF